MSIFSEYTKYIMVYKAWEASSMASDPLRPDPISTFPSHGHDRGASLPASLHFSACHCLPPLCWYNLHRLLRQSTSPMQFWRNSDQNFLAWKHQVEPVLKAHRLHRFVVYPLLDHAANQQASIQLLCGGILYLWKWFWFDFYFEFSKMWTLKHMRVIMWLCTYIIKPTKVIRGIFTFNNGCQC